MGFWALKTFRKRGEGSNSLSWVSVIQEAFQSEEAIFAVSNQVGFETIFFPAVQISTFQ